MVLPPKKDLHFFVFFFPDVASYIMNHLTRAGKEALKQLSTRGFASGSDLPSRKVAVLGAAGTSTCGYRRQRVALYRALVYFIGD